MLTIFIAGGFPTIALRNFFANLEPGLVTGAADDDPSGISTYSVAGARFGYTPLRTAWVSFPLMVAVPLMCGRLGAVTGQDSRAPCAAVIRRACFGAPAPAGDCKRAQCRSGSKRKGRGYKHG
jgi:hypothetical protein